MKSQAVTFLWPYQGCSACVVGGRGGGREAGGGGGGGNCGITAA